MTERSEIESRETPSVLSPYRVLDLADEKGSFCGRVLGDFGADVIKLERPSGDPARRIGPFYHDIPQREKSLHWFAYNANKRGITLNIETADGKELFSRLVEGADFVIESFSPGYMDGIGLGYDSLKEINPRIIVASISPFGQAKPYRDYEACDLVTAAMGGMIYPYGDADRSPVRISVEQCFLHAGAHAAVACMLALHARQLTGAGQWIDISVQECISMIPMIDVGWWLTEGMIVPRLGTRRRRGNIVQRDIWPCKDGHIGFRILGGSFSSGMRHLAEWMDSEGKLGSLEEVEDWAQMDVVVTTQEQADRWERSIKEFFLTHTRSEIYAQALQRGISLLPGYTPADLLHDEQLEARRYWVNVAHPELGDTLTYPGAPCKLTKTPWRLSRRGPLVGEHNEEVYCMELGLSKQELIILKEARVI